MSAETLLCGSLCTLHGGRDEGALWGLIYEGTNPFAKGFHPHDLITPSAAPSNIVTLNIRFQHMNSEGTRAMSTADDVSPAKTSFSTMSHVATFSLLIFSLFLYCIYYCLSLYYIFCSIIIQAL